MNLINQLLENVKKEKFTYLLETIFGGVDLAGMQSLSKYNKWISIYYVQLICLVNIRGLFL